MRRRGTSWPLYGATARDEHRRRAMQNRLDIYARWLLAAVAAIAFGPLLLAFI